MAHEHSHGEPANTYFLDQLCTIAVCGLLAFVAIMGYRTGLLARIKLHPDFRMPVIIAGSALVVMVALRALSVWRQAGAMKGGQTDVAEAIACGHNHAHDEACGHEHSHGHEHAHAESREAATRRVSGAERLDHSHEHAHNHGHEHSHGHEHAHNHGHEHSHAENRDAATRRVSEAERSDHGHEHSHSHGHEHSHGYEHSHAENRDAATRRVSEAERSGHGHEHAHSEEGHEEHDHGWAAWTYAVLMLPVVLYFLGLPTAGENLTRRDQNLAFKDLEPGMKEKREALAHLGGSPVLFAFRKQGPPINLRFSDLAVYAARDSSRNYFEGRTVKLVGQYKPNPSSDREFKLYREKVTCCGNDAVFLNALIVAPKPVTGVGSSEWIEITGELTFKKQAGDGQWIPVVELPSNDEIRKTDARDPFDNV